MLSKKKVTNKQNFWLKKAPDLKLYGYYYIISVESSMTGETQTYPYVSPGPIKLPPGSLTPVEELPGDSDLDDDGSQAFDSQSDVLLSNIEEDDDDGEEEGTLRERDAVFEKIKESLSKTHRSDSVSALSTISDVSDGPHVQISDQYTSIPYGIQPKATYEHSSMHADIMGGKIYLDIL